MTAKQKWWSIDAGSPSNTSGETNGTIQAPTEELARARYLGQRPEGWVIFAISETEAPKNQKPLPPSEDTQYADPGFDMNAKLKPPTKPKTSLDFELAKTAGNL